MEEQTLTWTTTHTSDTMTHDFGNGYKIVVDKNLNVAYKTKDNETRETFSTAGLLLETFEQIQINFAKSIK